VQAPVIPVEPKKSADDITKWTLRIPAEPMTLVEKLRVAGVEIER
jgi:hypothetical protein